MTHDITTRPSGATPRRWMSIIAAALIGSLLAGCISLLPKTKPAQLYRFGAEPAAAPAATATAAGSFTVRTAPIGFDLTSAGPGILTTRGGETAFIAGARWVSPATDLFSAAVVHAFDARPGPATLLSRGENRLADYSLRLDVRRFEARYLVGAQAAPTIMVELHAVMTGSGPQGATVEKTFRTDLPASDNRIGAITSAFDDAVGKVLGALVTWVDGRGAV